MILYRPVGQKEYELIAATDFTKFPPRLPEQPIFYPVLAPEYADQINRQWNRNGYTLMFEIDDEYANNFPIHQVGAQIHRELWVPAEELETFNTHKIGKIKVISRF